jgi:hypothetical protein
MENSLKYIIPHSEYFEQSSVAELNLFGLRESDIQNSDFFSLPP